MLRSALATFTAFLLTAACSVDVGVFDEGGAIDDGSGGATASSTNATTATTSQGGSGTSSSSSAQGGSTSAQGGSSSVSSTGSMTTTVATTTATSSSSSSVATTTSTSSGTSVSIPCGNQTCTGTDICCVHYQYDSQNKCAPPGQCGNFYIPVGCNGPMDCAMGEVCCGHFVQNQGYQSVQCEPSCQSGGGVYGIVMCGDDPNACGSGQSCYQSQSLPPGHLFCQ